jgi:cell division septal protein FtsQ
MIREWIESGFAFMLLLWLLAFSVISTGIALLVMYWIGVGPRSPERIKVANDLETKKLEIARELLNLRREQ